jgi:hypothetical protein
MKAIVLPIAPPGYRPQSADCSIEYEYIREWAGKLELMPLYTQATIEAGVSNLSERSSRTVEIADAGMS